jgi:hypothetical protein
MTPAPSVILFTVLSGMGFGLLAFLGAGFVQPAGWAAFFHWGLGYALAVGGLSAATFHLGNPQRALRAFTQWQTSWLSREAWASVVTLLLLAPVALSDWLGLGWPRISGLIGAVACFATVFTTSMIYALIAILSVALVALIAWPLVSGRVPTDPDAAGQALQGAEDELSRSLDAIREIDMDHRAGNLSDADFAELDREERARAVELMNRRDALRDEGSTS